MYIDITLLYFTFPEKCVILVPTKGRETEGTAMPDKTSGLPNEVKIITEE